MSIEKLNEEFNKELSYGSSETSDLTSHIRSGIAYLEALVGNKLDFEENVFARSILRDYVRYSVNNSTEYFEENFERELVRLQLIEGVKWLESEQKS